MSGPKEAVLISDGTLSASILPYGASLADLRHSGWSHPLVLGFPNREDYVDAPHYSGAIVGRCANRIANGRPVINGIEYQLDCNVGSYHHHGGKTGLARQDWRIVSHRTSRVELAVESPDGHEGYPGNLSVRAIYDLPRPGVLRLTVTAATDKPTILNLCHHPYFNLTASGLADKHRVTIAADRYLVADEELVPTGQIAHVAGTNLDFRQPRTPMATPDMEPNILNHTYCLAEDVRDTVVFAGRLEPDDGPGMEVWTNQTGLHFYNGYRLPDGLVDIYGRTVGPYSGVCMEAQGWTNAPCHAHFPSIEFLPHQDYRYEVEYRFE